MSNLKERVLICKNIINYINLFLFFLSSMIFLSKNYEKFYYFRPDNFFLQYNERPIFCLNF